MSVFSKAVNGTAKQALPIVDMQNITQGVWIPASSQRARDESVPHSFQGLTECPCFHLDRFKEHGGLIRAAYEDAVVDAIQILSGNPIINVVVIASGGLLQEAVWLSKLYQKHKPLQINLHLVDLTYKQDDPRLANLAEFAGRIVAASCTLNIYGWSSCLALAAEKTMNLAHLVIGMDTDTASLAVKEYQWKLLIKGDVEKTLFVRWLTPEGNTLFRIYARRGSDKALGSALLHK